MSKRKAKGSSMYEASRLDEKGVLHIPKYRMGDLKTDMMIYLIGPTGCGKSTLLMDILFHLRDRFDFILAMTPTIDTARDWAKVIPSGCIHTDFNEALLMEMVQKLENRQKQFQEVPRLLVITDDCMFDPSFLKTSLMKKIHMQGRHFGVTYINCVQYVMAIPPNCRESIRLCFAFYNTRQDNRQNLYNNFFNMGFNCFDDFEKAFAKATRDRRCMVMDNTFGVDPARKICFYKAELHDRRFCVGTRALWIYNEELLRAAQKKKQLTLLEEEKDKKSAEDKGGNPNPSALQLTAGSQDGEDQFRGETDPRSSYQNAKVGKKRGRTSEEEELGRPRKRVMDKGEKRKELADVVIDDYEDGS